MIKKSILTVAMGLCIGTSIIAQTQRTILYEEFTGENCNPCAATNPGLTTFIHQPGYFPSKVILLRYQCNIPSAPGTGSLYLDSKTDETVRQTYYSVPFAPYARFNGDVLPEPASQGTGDDGHAYWIEDADDYPNIVPDSAIVNAPFALTVTHSFNSTYDSVTVIATITAAQAITTTSLVLQIAMQEAEVHFASPTGTNGEKDFYDVMRKMIPSSSGTTLNNTWNNGDIQTITLHAKIPTYIHDKNQIAFVGFVQENATKRVHQAAYSQAQPMSLDAATIALNNLVIACTSTLAAQATISNPAATTLNSVLVNYKIDAGTASNYTWTGSLSQGTSTMVAIPTLSGLASGTHTLTVYTSAPNGGTDYNSGNDTKTSIFVIEPSTATPAPVVQGFTVTTFPPAGWVKNNALGGTSSWARATTGYAPTTGNSAKYTFYTNGNDGDIDELYLPTIDLSTIQNAQLSYDWAYNYYDDGSGDIIYDSLNVLISQDCGITWNSLYLDGGLGLTTAATQGDANEYVPTSSEWQTQHLDISSYGGSNNVLIKFSAINHYGNDLFIDNVNINDATSGIEHNKGNINGVSVYPNPANTTFNVNVNLAQEQKTTITLYNVMGQVVFTKSYNFDAGQNIVTLPADQLASGMYTASVTSANGSWQTKVSIVK